MICDSVGSSLCMLVESYSFGVTSMYQSRTYILMINGFWFHLQGFFNFTSRRPRHLLQILELGYSVMYNDVDMVWLADPFLYLKGKHDVYFMDDMAAVSLSSRYLSCFIEILLYFYF